ncbi:MAG TPA: hypothetical protein PL105_09785 [Caldilineaceae bacterium]|nr:hypothetical protein [Caldilineaceae bacterium]
MTITIHRLDCPGTIAVMIAIVNRHALSADGARQHALDEIASSLHNIDAIIRRHQLAPLLESRIPPIPPRHRPGDDDLDTGGLADEKEEEEEQAVAVSAPSPATRLSLQ